MDILYQTCNSNNTRNKIESLMLSEDKCNIIEFRDRKILPDKIYYFKKTTGADIPNLSELSMLYRAQILHTDVRDRMSSVDIL